jgi:predicted Ser/Thr protein kinase
MGAADYLKKNLAKIRPNAMLAAVEPAPKLMQILQDRARQNEQAAAQYRLQKRIRPDVIQARLKYNLNGQSVEEWVIVATIIDGTAGLKGGYSYNCLATMVAERAPQGQLEASEKLFELINSTYRLDQAWQSRVTQNALAIQKIRAKGVQDRANIVSKNAEDIRNIQREGYENQQKAQDQSATQFSQYLRGTETYQNPATGEKVDLDSKYGNAWVNSRGEYLLSDQAGFDPNTVLQESWTPMQHVKP